MSGTGLQRPAVEHLARAAQTHHGNLQVGQQDAAEGRAQYDDSAGEAVDVVEENILTRQFEQRGIVTEWAGYYPSAPWKAGGKTHEDRNRDEGCHPGAHWQLHHHPAGHDGGVS